MDKSNQLIAATAATIGAFGLGTVLSWTSPGIPAILEDQSEDNPLRHISDEAQSWIGAILSLGAMLSAPVCGVMMDTIGRKNAMLVLAIPFILGWLLVGFAQNLAMMLIGRFITGFCGGGFSLVAPVYIGETADEKIRGALGSAFQLMVVLGIEFVYVVGEPTSWKWLSYICGFVPAIFMVIMVFVSESPRYFLMKDKPAEAEKALMWFRKASSPEHVAEELKDMQNAVNETKAQKATFGDLMIPYNLKPALIMFGLMFFQQLSGINAVIFYTQTIFESAGSDLSPSTSTMIVGGVQIAATLGAVFLVDILGRRILLIMSDVVMGISLVALGLFFQLQENGNADSIGWLPLVSLLIFITAFSVGFGPLPWMMLGELLPAKIKGLTAALATMLNWFLSFLVTKFYGDLLSAFGSAWAYWTFAIICGVGTVFVFIFVPETKGKSLEEIQLGFGAPAIVSSSTSSPTNEDSEKNKY